MRRDPKVARIDSPSLSIRTCAHQTKTRSPNVLLPSINSNWNSKQVALLASWCMTIFASTTMLIVAEVFQADAPRFPLTPTLFAAAMLATAATAISVLIGKGMHGEHSFLVYQPFVGGNRFVAMQAVGYLLLVTTDVAALGYTTVPNEVQRRGILSVVAIMGLIGNIILLASVFTFERPSAADVSPNKSSSKSFDDFRLLVGDRLGRSPNRETMLIAVFTVTQIVLCAISTYQPSLSGVLSFVVTMFHVLTGLLLHCVIGYKHTPGYRLFMPAAGSLGQMVLQVVCWTVYFVTLNGGAGLVVVGASAPPMSHVALGSGCFISTVALVLFTRLAKFQRSNGSSDDFITSFGSWALSMTSATQTAVVLLLTAVIMLRVVDIESNWLRGITFCQTVSASFLLMLPPCTHCVGRLRYGAQYKIFQPFKGGADFIMLQCAGWTCYGFSILFLMLHVTGTNYDWIFLEAVTSFAAQVFVHCSIGTFHHQRSSFPVIGSAALAVTHPQNLWELLWFLNGEMCTAFLCMSCALVLRILVDIANWKASASLGDQGGSTFPTDIVLLTATLLYACATPLAHFSGRHHHIPLFRPFDGSGMYVALQSIGWTIYAAFLLTILFSWVTSRVAFHMDAEQAAALAAATSLLASFTPSFLSTSYGVSQFIPLVLVSTSVIVEAMHMGEHSQHEDGFAAALRELDSAEQLLRDVAPGEYDDVARRLLLAAAQIRATGKWMHRVPVFAAEDADDETSPLLSNNKTHNPNGSFVRSRHQAALVIVLLMSFASLAAFSVGSFWSQAQPIFGIGFATGGLAIVTTSCVALHCGYGAFLHSECGRYTYFMPFAGGGAFVKLQSIGWMSYTTCAVLTIACAIERRGNPIALVLAGVSSVVAQVAILESVPLFDPAPHAKSFLQTHSAAIVAACTFFASFVFTHLYGRFRDQTFASDVNNNAPHASSLIPTGQVVPLVVSAVSMTFAIPLTFVALRSRIKHGELSGDTSDSSTSSELPRARRLVRDALVAVDSLVFFLSLSVPAVIAYFGYYTVHNLMPEVSLLAEQWKGAMLTLGLLMVIPLVVAASQGDNVAVLSALRRWREAFVTFQVYLIPTHATLLSYSMPLIFPGSLSATYFAVAMSLLTVGAHVRLVRLAVMRFSYVLLGYVAYDHCRLWLVEGEGSPLALLIDAGLLVFWVRYEKWFRNKPQETGVLRSPWFVALMKRHVIPDIESYFRLRLVVDTPGAVDLGVPSNKYIFSYHPHGIFPGTALFLPLTKQWEQQVGTNSAAHVTSHAAGIIFNVPMVRDFLLRIGGRIVTRSSIEGSLNEGNSVVIVTGGQAEMLHTGISRCEMHLVTHHFGFIKLAIRQHVPVVPLLCFTENNVMDNVHLPWLQSKMLKLIGFPFPTVPHGRWFLPLPHRTPLTVVVGRPMLPPVDLSPDDDEGVKSFSNEYFAELKDMFYRHRKSAGYPEMELVLHGH